MSERAVQITGLKELRRELRKLEDAKAWSNRLKDEHVKIARMVVDRGNVLAKKRTQMVLAAKSNRAVRSVSGASIRMGGVGRARDWALGAQFGSERFRQFPPHVKGGYTIYPALGDLRKEIVQVYADGIERIVADAFPSPSPS